MMSVPEEAPGGGERTSNVQRWTSNGCSDLDVTLEDEVGGAGEGDVDEADGGAINGNSDEFRYV